MVHLSQTLSHARTYAVASPNTFCCQLCVFFLMTKLTKFSTSIKFPTSRTSISLSLFSLLPFPLLLPFSLSWGREEECGEHRGRVNMLRANECLGSPFPLSPAARCLLCSSIYPVSDPYDSCFVCETCLLDQAVFDALDVYSLVGSCPHWGPWRVPLGAHRSWHCPPRDKSSDGGGFLTPTI